MKFNTHFNKRKKQVFMLLTFNFFCCFSLFSQNFVPVSGSTNTINYPSGGFTHFYDQGGPGGSVCPGPRTDLVPGNYPNCNCNTVITLVPDNPSQPIEVDFFEFGLFANFDYLIVYDNNTSSGPELYNNGAGGAQNNERCPGPDTLRATNPTGALTFFFHASGVVDDAGFGFEVIQTAPPVPDDAGISKVVEPSDTCAGVYDVKAEVANYGTNIIDSVQINWSIDGVMQTPLTYSTPLDTINGSGINKAVLTLGTINLIANNSYSIKVWTSLPNAVNDTSNSNDTATTPVFGYPFPTIDLGADVTICPGELAVLDGGTGRDSLRWSTNATTPTLSVGTAGQYHVTVYENGCLSRDTVNVALFPAPPTVDLGPDTILCDGESLLLDATAPGVTYLWQDNSINPTFTVNSAGNYSVTIEDANGCLSSDDINVSYFNDPSVTITVSPSSQICFGAPITFRAIPSTQGSIAYQWKINGTSAGPTATGQTFNGPVDHGDTVTVDLITDVCATTPYPVSSNKIGMTVLPEPKSINGANQVLENTTEVYVVPLITTSDYLWRVQGGTISGDSTSNIVNVNWGTKNPAASISLFETDNINCTRENKLDVTIISIVGINHHGHHIGLGDAYPNPSSDLVTIPVNANGNWMVELDLFDISGKLVRQIFSGTVTGNRLITLPVGDLENGLYFYQLTADGYKTTRKLTIQH